MPLGLHHAFPRESIMKLRGQQRKTATDSLTMDSSLFRRRAIKKRRSKWVSTSSLLSNESPLTPEPKRARRTVSGTLRQPRKTSSDSMDLTALSIRLTDILTILCKRNDDNKATETSQIVSAVVDHAMRTRFGKPETLVSALILLDRLQTSRDGIRVTTHTVRVVYGMCVLLAGKFLLDESIWNYEARKMLGLSRGVNETERRFLEIIRWRVWIGEEEYLVYRSAVLG